MWEGHAKIQRTLWFPSLEPRAPAWVPAVSSSYYGVGETGSAAPFLLWIGLDTTCDNFILGTIVWPRVIL